MKRKFFTVLIILASLLALSLTACNGNTGETNEGSSSELTAETTEAISEEAADETDESSSSEQTAETTETLSEEVTIEETSEETETEVLDKVSDIKADENGKLTWASVEKATGYTVRLTAPDGKESLISLGADKTEFSDTYSAMGVYTVSVQANADRENIIASEFSEPIKIKRISAPSIEKIESDATDLSAGFKITLTDAKETASYELYKGDTKLQDFSSSVLEVKDFYDETVLTGQNIALTLVSKGVISNDTVILPSTLSFSVTVLPSPEILGVTDHKLCYSAVEGSQGYRIAVNSETYDISELTYDLDDIEAGEYDISVYAKGDGEYILPSVKSSQFRIVRLTAPTDVKISLARPKSITLNRVEHAVGYHMTVDGSEDRIALGTVEDVRDHIKDLSTVVHVYSSADYYNDDRTVFYMESKDHSIASFSGFGGYIANKVKIFFDSIGTTYSESEVESISATHSDKLYANSAVPDFYEDHISEVENKINDKLSKIENGGSFIFLTDVHIYSNQMLSVPLVQHITQNTSVNEVFCGGDLLGAYSTPGVTNSKEKSIVEAIATLELYSQLQKDADFYYVRGNHDFTIRDIQADNKTRYDTGYTLPYKDTVDLAMSYQGDGAVIPDDEALYFYVDDSEQKIRYIVVDTHTRNHASEDTYWGVYSGLDPEQKDWLINTALQLEDGEGWSVVIFGHIPCAEGQNSYSSKLNTLADIIKDFNNKRAGAEWDFTDAKAEFVAYICGHSHVDEHIYVDDTLFISTGSSAKYKDDVWERPANDVGQDLFDVFVIDKDKKILTAIRIGAGEDREFNY